MSEIIRIQYADTYIQYADTYKANSAPDVHTLTLCTHTCAGSQAHARDVHAVTEISAKLNKRLLIEALPIRLN